jgi:hypothetical protein
MFSWLDLIGFMAIAALYTYGLILLIEILQRRVRAWSWTQVGLRKGKKIVNDPST